MGVLGRLFGWLFGKKKKEETVVESPSSTEEAAPEASKTDSATAVAETKSETVQQEVEAPEPIEAEEVQAVPPPQPKQAKEPVTAPTSRTRRTPPPQPGVKQPPPEYENDPDHKKARRISRGQLSDLKEYHYEELKEAVKNNTFEQVFAEQLRDMRENYYKRVPKHVHEVFDYFEYAIENLKAEIRKELES